MRGVEVPMVVVFTNFIAGQHNDNVFSRCSSSLIVVCNKESADMIYPDSEQYSFAFKIEIEGKIIFLIIFKKSVMKMII
jgi:hypothetical protein